MKLFKTTTTFIMLIILSLFSGCEPEDDDSNIVPEAKVVGKYKHKQSGVIIDVRYNLGVKWGYIEIIDVGNAFPESAKGAYVVRNLSYIGENLWQGENMTYYPGRNPEWTSSGFISVWLEKGNSLRIGTQFYDRIN